MIILSNTAEQTLAPGQSITFNKVIKHTGDGECYGRDPASVTLRKRGCNVSYEIHFNANVSGPTAATPVQLSIQTGGVTLPETTMISVPAAVGDFNNVATATSVGNCCDQYNRVTVTNTGANSIIIGANPNLFIKRTS